MKFPTLFVNLDNYHSTKIDDPKLPRWVFSVQNPPHGDNDVSQQIAQLDAMASKNHFKHFLETTYKKSHSDNDFGVWLLKPTTSKMNDEQYLNHEIKYDQTALQTFVQQMVKGEQSRFSKIDSMTKLMNSSTGLSLICGLIISANKLGITDNTQEIEKLFVFLLHSYSNISWHNISAIGLMACSAALMMFGPLVQSLLK